MSKQLTFSDRDRIAQMRFQGHSQEAIAQAIGRCPATIRRELRRNGTRGVYHAAAAQRMAERRRAQRPLVRKMDRPEINEAVRIGLVNEWSPEQIAGRLKQQIERREQDQPPQTVSPQTIYTWIDGDEHREHWKGFLRRRGKRPYRRKPAKKSDAARIKDQPEVIEERLRFGDFEGDTAMLEIRCSARRARTGVATLVDRKSRFTIIVKVKSKNADHVHGQIKRRLQELDEEHRRSFTLDNGTEFARCRRLEKHLGMKLYFAEERLSVSTWYVTFASKG